MTYAQKQKASEMIVDGMLDEDIAEELGIDEDEVWRFRKFMGDEGFYG